MLRTACVGTRFEQLQRFGVGQRPDGHHELALDAERLAAGGDDVEIAAGVGQLLGGVGGRLEHVFAIVENEHDSVGSEHSHQRVQRVVRPVDASGRGDRAEHVVGVVHLGQAHHPRRRDRGLFGGRLHREAGLAHTSGSDERDHGMLLDQRGCGGDVFVAADQLRALDGQVVREGVEASERRQVAVERGVHHLPDALRLGQVA